MQKLKPEILAVKDEKGLSTLYRVATLPSGNGTINGNGAEFVTGVDNTLVVTVALPVGIDAKAAREFIFDKVAKAKPYIEKIEAAVADQYDAIEADEKAFLDSIEIG